MNLSAAELALTRADRRLGALSNLLDSERLQSQLVDSSGKPLPGKVEKRYIRYKPGMNCLVAYDLMNNGQVTSIYAKAFSADFEEKRDKAFETENPEAYGARRLWDFPDEQYLVRRFPNDGKLTSLQRLADDDQRRAFMQRLLPLHPEYWGTNFVELAYKPERRYVCRIQDDTDARAVVKLYSATAFRRSLANCRFLMRRDYACLPPLIGHSNKHRAIVFGWYPGSTFRDAASQDIDARHYAQLVGRELAALHKLKTSDDLRSWSPLADSDVIRQLAKTLTILLPAAGDLISHLTAKLSDRLGQVQTHSSVIHGDFHSKQILLHKGRVRFLDLDELSVGAPEYDLGTFLAHIRRDVLRGYLQPETATRIAEGFLGGYMQHGFVPRHLGLYTALALLKFSHHPFRACEQDWELGIQKILIAAAALVYRDDIPSALRISESNL